MGKIISKVHDRARLWIQIIFAAITNGYILGYVKGRIFTGSTKVLCVPGLNCYSCPGALGSCPIGSLQAVLGSRDFKISFYILGFFMIIGSLMGRVVCGWLCPFGLVQDLLYKIPFVKKRKGLPGDRWLKWLKYVMLLLFVIILPMFVVDILGQGLPWFCKYICPSGTLMAGIPLVAVNESLQGAIGVLFWWKVSILAVIVFLSILVYRPFCKYLCPLGAVYGIFNPIAFYRFSIDEQKCTHCKVCQKVCKMDIPVWEKPNSSECIRCQECKHACPHGAICDTIGEYKKVRKKSDARG